MPCSICKSEGHNRRNCGKNLCEHILLKGKNKGKTCGKRNCKFHKPVPAEFTIDKIQNDEKVSESYIKKLSEKLPCSFKDLIDNAYDLIPELRDFCESRKNQLSIRDKGSLGKMAEFHIFGILPNNNSAPDIRLGDIKTTHVKRVSEEYLNAKERLTITNVGSTSNYDTIRRGILIVLLHEKGEKWMDADNILNRKVISFFNYDITQKEDWLKELKSDYEKIRGRVITRTVSQKGQNFLHIHPHGCKKSSTRAFGFTNKFLTRMICDYTNRSLITKGKSLYFKEK